MVPIGLDDRPPLVIFSLDNQTRLFQIIPPDVFNHFRRKIRLRRIKVAPLFVEDRNGSLCSVFELF